MKTIPVGEYQFSQFMLGTVQFGLAYGIANRQGQPAFRDVCAILEAAHAGGVNCLDTAPFYGESEEVLGRALHETGLTDKMFVVTKALRSADPALSADEIAAKVEEQVTTSLRRLRIEVLPLCLVHAEENFAYAESLQRLQGKGLIRHIGCSTVNLQPTREIVGSGLATAVQIPTNILDRRYSHSGFFEEAAQNKVAVFVRSAYLQGLLVMPPENVPPDLREVVPVLQKLRALAVEAGIGIEELALRYVLSLKNLSCAVVGVDTAEQVRRNLELFERGPLEESVLEAVSTLAFDLPEKITSPFLWQKRMPDMEAKSSAML